MSVTVKGTRYVSKDTQMCPATALSVSQQLDAVSLPLITFLCINILTFSRIDIHVRIAEDGGFCRHPGECICHSGYSGGNCTDELSKFIWERGIVFTGTAEVASRPEYMRQARN